MSGADVAAAATAGGGFLTALVGVYLAIRGQRHQATQDEVARHAQSAEARLKETQQALDAQGAVIERLNRQLADQERRASDNEQRCSRLERHVEEMFTREGQLLGLLAQLLSSAVVEDSVRKEVQAVIRKVVIARQRQWSADTSTGNGSSTP